MKFLNHYWVILTFLTKTNWVLGYFLACLDKYDFFKESLEIVDHFYIV